MSIEKRKSLPRAGRLLIGLILMTLIFYSWNFFNLQRLFSKTLDSLRQQSLQLTEAKDQSDLKKITALLESIQKETSLLAQKTNSYGTPQILNLLNIIKPGIKEAPSLLTAAASLSDHALNLSKDLELLSSQGLKLLWGEKGDELLAILRRLQNTLRQTEPEIKILNASANQLANLSPVFASTIGEFQKRYLPTLLFLNRLDEALASFLTILQKPNGSHLLLLFQNPSEMRPTGGFIGSFGVLSLENGGLKNLFIDDIYNADRQLAVEKIPPQPLQLITPRWGARDANWFFDFPTSAKKVSEFLEASALFQNPQIRFDGTLAMNTKVLESLIEAIGPIRLDAYNLTIDAQNFLREIQYEVEAGRDKKPGQNPKRILSALAPLLIEKLKNLTPEQTGGLQEKLLKHLTQKDVLLYFQNGKIGNFLINYGLAGDVLTLPRNFSGNYLAIVNANIGGGKSDAFINQEVQLEIFVNQGGKTKNELTITRKHSGQHQKEWWYRANNKNYLRVLLPLQTKLLSVIGQDSPPALPKWKAMATLADADIELLENQYRFLSESKIWEGEEVGKAAVGFWLNTPAGKKRTAKLSYETSVMKLENGSTYELIYEKQSGVTESINFLINAPSGYLWKESGTSTYQYQSNEPNGRERVVLTLEKN